MTSTISYAPRNPGTICLAVCADHGIFGLLVGLLLSLQKRDRTRYHIGVIDVGLSAAQRDFLRPLCDALEPVSEDRLIGFSAHVVQEVTEASPFWRAQACRPFLREYFPGYGGYMHLDADMWVQNPAFLDDVTTAIMNDGQVVIVPEIDVSYAHYTSYASNMEYMSAKAAVTKQIYGDTIADQTASLPYFNTGFFAMRWDLPHWELFKDVLRRANPRGYHHVSEQIAFNLVLLKLNGFRPFPAQCNWMCSMAAPVRGSDGLWRLPTYPHTVIDLLHLTGTDKLARYRPLGMLYDDGRYLDEIAGLL